MYNRIPLTQELKILELIANIDAQTSFLARAIESIKATGHDLTDKEKYGFHICMNSLRDDVKTTLKIGGKI